MEIGGILVQAAAASAFAKPLVDILKKTPMPTPSWSLPILAIGIGILISFLLMLMSDDSVTIASIAASTLAGISAGVSAIAVTELQRNTDT